MPPLQERKTSKQGRLSMKVREGAAPTLPVHTQESPGVQAAAPSSSPSPGCPAGPCGSRGNRGEDNRGLWAHRQQAEFASASDAPWRVWKPDAQDLPASCLPQGDGSWALDRVEWTRSSAATYARLVLRNSGPEEVKIALLKQKTAPHGVARAQEESGGNSIRQQEPAAPALQGEPSRAGAPRPGDKRS